MEFTEIIYKALTAKHSDFTREELADATELSDSDVTAGLEQLQEAKRTEALTDNLFVSDTAAKRLRDTARRILSTYHKRNPYKQAMRTGDLLEPLAKAATIRNFNTLVTWLENDRLLVREGNRSRLTEHAIVLPPHWQEAAEEMLPVFIAGGLTDPPWPGNFRANFPRDINVTVILDALAEQGKLARLEDDLYLSIEAIEQAKIIIEKFAHNGKEITVGTVRDATGSSRRIVVPLLEWLDTHGFTIRDGETRRIAE